MRCCLLSVLLFCCIQASLATTVSVSTFGGIALPRLENNNDVRITSNQINSYITQQKTRVRPLIGARFAMGIVRRRWDFDVGLLAIYSNLGHVAGTEFPFSNDGQFDPLGYHLTMRSIAGFIDPRFLYPGRIFRPYIHFGLGIAFNRAYHYREFTIPDSGGAAPVPTGFSGYTNTHVAYMGGAGVLIRLIPGRLNQLFLGSEFGWLDLGKAKLDKMPSQTVSSRLTVNKVAMPYGFISLEYRHGV